MIQTARVCIENVLKSVTVNNNNMQELFKNDVQQIRVRVEIPNNNRLISLFRLLTGIMPFLISASARCLSSKSYVT